MARSFHVGAVKLNIGMTAYLLTLAVLIPINGWVADRFGSRTVFASTIAIFTVSSLVCGLSQTLTQFTLMRILQGSGGAMMVPVGRLIVLSNTPKDKLTEAIAYIIWPGLTALVLGPVRRLITSYLSWHWIFFISLPLGAVASPWRCSGSKTFAPESAAPSTGSRFLLAACASTGDVTAIEKLGGQGVQWEWPTANLAICILRRRPRGSRRPPSPENLLHRCRFAENQNLFEFDLWCEYLPDLRFGASFPASAHVPDRVWPQRVSLRALSSDPLRW